METACRHGGGTHAEAPGLHGGFVTGDGVFVRGDADEFEDTLDAGAVDVAVFEVDENEVVICAAANDGVAEAAFAPGFAQSIRQGFRVRENSLLVFLELFCLRLLQSDCEGRDGVIVRTALVAWEDGCVDGTFEVVEFLITLLIGSAYTFAEKDHGAPWTAERFMRRRRDDIGVGEGGRNYTACNKAGYVGHVTEKVGAYFVGDGAHAVVFD